MLHRRTITVPVLFLVCLLASFSRLDLLDRTESRVAVVAARLLEHNDLLHLSVPKDGDWIAYWAKPPLHYWHVAQTLQSFGRSEWAVRLPSLLASLGVLLLIPFFKSRAPANAQLITASAALFFGISGLGIIDASLTFALAVALLGIFRWCAAHERTTINLVFMAGGAALACALKGLVGLAIPALTVLLFCAFRRSLTPLRELPWLPAGALCGVLIGAYFGFIEQAAPGFNRYFFVHENILRFLTSEYGDRTGSGHRQLYGTSILFAFVAFLPWSPLLIQSVRQSRPAGEREQFLWAAALAPIVLFLLARHHLATYQTPAILPAALLLGDRLERSLIRRVGLGTLLLLAIIGLGGAPLINSEFSAGPVLAAAADAGAERVHFQREIPLSAYWYAGDRLSIDTVTPGELSPRQEDLFVVRSKHLGSFSSAFGARCSAVQMTGKWSLYRCAPQTDAAGAKTP